MSETNVIEFTEEEYDQMVRLVEEIKEKITQLDSILGGDDEVQTPLKYLLMKRIHDEGSIVEKPRFNQLAEEVGYADKRGPQGLFAWGGKYVTLIGEDKVGLTPKGIQRLKDKRLIE